jgi:hypothetical protein
MNMMRNLWLVAIVSMVMTIVACGGKGNETPANPKAPVPPKEIISDKTNVEVGAAQFYGNIMSMLGNFEDDKELFDLEDVPLGGAERFILDKSGKQYMIKAFEDETLSEMYDDAFIEFGKVDDHIVAVCYAKDRMPLWTMVGFNSEDEYNDYRKACFTNLLKGKYKDSEGRPVTIDGSKITGLFGQGESGYEFSYINNYSSEIIRVDGKYYGIAVAEFGVTLLETVVDEEGSGERMTSDEVAENLEFDSEQDISWIHKHLLTSDYVMYISSAARKKMLDELTAVKSPTQTESWNLFILQAFKPESTEEEMEPPM